MTQVATVEQPHAHKMQLAYRYPADEIVKMLDSDAKQGLTAARAEQHLQRYGANALPEPAAPPAWRKFLSQFKGPLTVLLLLAMGVSVFAWLNERDTPIPFEALTILAIVLLNGLLGYIQENRAEQAVAALQAMSATTARVLRDGEQQRIPTAQVVPGDILLIEEGDTLPADARVLEAFALWVAEVALACAPLIRSSTSAVCRTNAKALHEKPCWGACRRDGVCSSGMWYFRCTSRVPLPAERKQMRHPFHIFVRGQTAADLDGVPTDRIFLVQLSDLEHGVDLKHVIAVARHHRLLPGQGHFPLAT